MKQKIHELFKQAQEGHSLALGQGHVSTSRPPWPQDGSQQSGVKLKRLPFYHVHGELLPALTLVVGGSGRFQEAQHQFLLTAEQATDIASNRDISPGSLLEYPYQVAEWNDYKLI